MLRCKDCYVKCLDLIYGRCKECHDDALECFGELGLVIDSLQAPGPERYQYFEPNTVFACFYRLERQGELFLVKTNERQWCLRLQYRDGYPCPPRLAFVNAYNHQDENPIWWPKTTFKLDPVRQHFDIPEVSERTAMFLPIDRTDPLHRWSPSHYVALIAPQIIP